MKGAHALVWLALASASAYVGLRRLERLLLFHPSRSLDGHPGVVGLAWEPLWLTASDGARLRAWWIPGPSEDAPVLLCLHGNAGNLSHRLDKMRLLRDAGAAQLWIEWRGYGESGGSPDEAGLYRDALAGWAWLGAVKGVPPQRLALYGESLGGGAAAELATRVPAAGLILDSCFSSVADMARVVVPWLPRRLLATRFDTASKLPRVAAPTLLLHSREDEIVPFAQAERNLAASGAARKELVELRGGHNDGFLAAKGVWLRALSDFLRSLPPPPRAR